MPGSSRKDKSTNLNNVSEFKKRKPKYTCPRCGYETAYKGDMRKHLYELNRPCPGCENNIVLTDEIKEIILTNRVYEIQTTDLPTTVPTINLNNLVVDMDTRDKIQNILDWRQEHTVNFGELVEANNSEKIENLENRKYRFGFQLDYNNIYEIIDQSVHIKKHEEICKMNLHYISELGKIAIYHDDEWTNYLYDIGLNKVISIIRNYYLESYEKYVLYKIFVDKSASAFECNEYKNRLNEYFRFLAVFDIYPSSKDIMNEEFLTGFSHENSFFISDFCMDRYNEQKIGLKKSDISKIRKQIGDIVKNNSTANVRMLNKYVINLAVNDENFKQRLLDYSSK